MIFSPSQRRRRRQLQISERRLLLIGGDIAAVIVSALIGLRIWAHVAHYAFTLDFILPQTYLFVILVGLWLLLASANDLYELRVAASRRRTLRHLMVITLQMILIYVVIFFISPRTALPRLFILYYGFISFVLIGLWRFTRPVLIGWVSEPRRTLIVGADDSALTMIDAIRKNAAHDYEIKGIIGEPADVGRLVSDVPVLGSGVDLLNFATRDRVSELIVTSTSELSAETFQAVMDAYERGIAVVPMPLMYEWVTGRVPVEHVKNDWAVVLLPLDGGTALYPMFKRVIDMALGLVGTIAFLVLLPFLALAIRLDSRGGIFFTQQRVGLNGHVFKMYKLRSMVENAEAETGAVFSQRGDPRVTRVGRFMRKTRLDELPQLLNVLRGDMSMVGPRPERPEHMQRLTENIPFYRVRLIVRPGVTGWAQVRYDYGSNDVDAQVKLEYDLYYIRHQSLMLDLNIIVRTIGKVLTLGGV